MPDFPAISHVAVTVSDLARSTKWCSVGLDHLAFSCATRAELEQWVSRLDDMTQYRRVGSATLRRASA